MLMVFLIDIRGKLSPWTDNGLVYVIMFQLEALRLRMAVVICYDLPEFIALP